MNRGGNKRESTLFQEAEMEGKRRVRWIFFVVFLLAAAVTTAGVAAWADETGKEALVVTWKNDGGYWFAIGPVQETTVGEKDEAKAIQYVKGRGRASWVIMDGRYNIYRMNRNLESYETDIREWMSDRGIIIPITLD